MQRLALLTLLTGGCAASDWTLDVGGEDYATRGIPTEDFVDGCNVVYDQAEVTLTEITHLAGPTDATAKAVDLTEGPSLVTTFQVPAQQGSTFATRIAPAGGHAVHVTGTITCEATTVQFDWTFDEDVLYTCVPPEVRDHHELTLHLDHFFYDALTETPSLRGRHLVAADLDNDGWLTHDELAATNVVDAGLDVKGEPLTTLADWMRHASTTLGHVDGETHCERELL